MNFDLRFPLGMMFSFYGLLLVGYGLATRGSTMYSLSLGLNMNVRWGAVLLVFGVTMFTLAWRGRKRG